MKIDKFGVDFNNKNIKTNETNLAGTKTIFKITLKGQTTTLVNKSNYSLILDLLKN